MLHLILKYDEDAAVCFKLPDNSVSNGSGTNYDTDIK